MSQLRDEVCVRDARQEFFDQRGFSEHDYTAPWVWLKVGRMPVAFPNVPERRRAVPLHDLHHIATGYDTTWVGEAEIGAWEIAAGCAGNRIAFALDLSAALLGLVIAPRRTLRAFDRGRQSQTLYADGWSDDLLDLTVGELRRRLRLA